MRDFYQPNRTPNICSLLTFSLVNYSNYSLLPWLLIYFHSRKFDSWSQVVISYGGFLLFLNLGLVLGEILSYNYKQLSSYFYSLNFILLALCFVLISFLTRFIWLAIFAFIIGFSGSILTSYSFRLDNRSPVYSLNESYYTNQNNVDYLSSTSSIITNQKILICFIFTTLLSGFLYNHEISIRFPYYYNVMVVVVGAFLIYIVSLITSNSSKTNVKVISRNDKSEKHNPNITFNNVTGNLTYNDGDDVGPFSSDSYPDSQPIPIEISSLPDKVPPNFLSVCGGNLTKSRQMYQKTKEWRWKYQVDKIFERKNRKFWAILCNYPHAIHGYSRDGCAVVYEVLGKGNPKGLVAAGVQIIDLVWHFNFRNEFVLRNVLNKERVKKEIEKTTPDVISEHVYNYPPFVAGSKTIREPIEGIEENSYVPRFMTVIDVEGISMSSVTADVLSFIQQNGTIIDNHYPEQVCRLVVCRAPRWFSMIWRLIAQVLPESVQKKVDILYDTAGLDKYIDPSQRPIEYGGTSNVKFGEWEGHKEFLAIAATWSGGHSGENAKPVVLHTQQSEATPTQQSALKRVGSAVKNRFGTIFKKSQKQEAFLGDKNSFYFNEVTQKWEMDLGEETSLLHSSTSSPSLKKSSSFFVDIETNSQSNAASSVNSPHSPLHRAHDSLSSLNDIESSQSSANLEEHGLVLAIQAAHYAANATKNTKSTTNSLLGSSNTSPTITSRVVINTPVFLLSLFIHILVSFTYHMFHVLLPVWLSAPLKSGGLSYGAYDIGLVLSCSGLILLHLSMWFGSLCDWMLRASPVRVLRIFSIFSFVFLFLFVKYIRKISLPLEDIYHHQHYSGSPVSDMLGNIDTNLISLQHSEDFQTNSNSTDFATGSFSFFSNNSNNLVSSSTIFGGVFNQEFNILPSKNISILFYLSLFISLIYGSLYICMKAINMMVFVALSGTFSSPLIIINSINYLGQIFSPFFLCLIYSIIYSLRLKFPLNSSFFLSFSSCLCLLFYILCINFVILFHSDYGTTSDLIFITNFNWKRKFLKYFNLFSNSSSNKKKKVFSTSTPSSSTSSSRTNLSSLASPRKKSYYEDEEKNNYRSVNKKNDEDYGEENDEDSYGFDMNRYNSSTFSLIISDINLLVSAFSKSSNSFYFSSSNIEEKHQ